ncbi:hypothetical protein VIGAN_01478200 [Vigna angularis var. angularis]|uniref:Uncharacterized protein n=1 Tax=Vigna angularis var. angularis TaxID=157739 RepID=A0A0S3R824_PHAAN|nr:hypothetical protein VIGAN_01478200 [Vigna angularis var. angularis]
MVKEQTDGTKRIINREQADGTKIDVNKRTCLQDITEKTNENEIWKLKKLASCSIGCLRESPEGHTVIVRVELGLCNSLKVEEEKREV